MVFGDRTHLSKIMQTRCHSKEFSEQNLILKRIVKFCSLKGGFSPRQLRFCLNIPGVSKKYPLLTGNRNEEIRYHYSPSS